MTTISSDEAARILRCRVEAVAGLWLVVLPLLRPLIWSGQPTDVANLFFLVLLAAAITTGLLLRGLAAPLHDTGNDVRWWLRPSTWGIAFLAFAVAGSLNSLLPADAWTLTLGWMLHLAAPWALWPAIRRRPQLVVIGLLAGLAGQVVLLSGQMAFERPHLAQQLASDPALTVERRVAEQYQARIGSWRLEGTFLLANTLASYLILLVPLLVACTWKTFATRMRLCWLVLMFAIAALIALGFSGSKAGILALLVAGVVCAVARLRSWRWRIAIVLGVVVALALVLSWPTLRRALSDSAGVRLDYWRAGIALVQERPLTGHGLEGFAVHYPRVKPPAGEETVVAHQETLQAAVDLGIPAMLVLLVWWAATLRSLRLSSAPIREERREEHAEGFGAVVLIGVPALLVFALFAAGVLHANFSTYPGASPSLWSALFIVVLMLVLYGLTRVPLPSPRACWCAVLAVLLHVQADFSLHSMQVVGVLAWVVVMGQALTHTSPPVEPAVAGPRRQALFAAAGLALLALVAIGIMQTSARGEVRDRAQATESLFARLRLAEQGRLNEEQREQVLTVFERAFSQIVVEDRGAALTADPREALALATIRRALEASRSFPADHDLVFTAVAIAEHVQALLPSRAEAVTPLLESMLAEWPNDLLVTKALSEHYLRLARRANDERRRELARHAQALAERAVDLYPTHLPLRQSVIKAAELTGDQTTANAQRAEIERLKPLVHRDNRLPE